MEAIENYAVIKTGGKQYMVQQDDVLDIELIQGDAGDAVTFEEVLAVAKDGDLTVGAPTVSGATVAAEIVETYRGPKIVAFKKKRRKGYTRKVGHRQTLTKIKITSI